MIVGEIDILDIDNGTVTAPAGCGKTHLIADALIRHNNLKPVLVLTHTNAGVAALRGRLGKAGVSPKAYQLSTIDGWAMRLLTLFPLRGNYSPDILTVSDPRQHYPAIRKATHELLEAGHISDILRASYNRLIVDEYQDCTEQQHAIVVSLSTVIPVCILGDPMQAIFTFAGRMPDWHQEVCKTFPIAGQLSRPWRWINAGEEGFGEYLLWVRKELEADRFIDLDGSHSNVKWVRLNGDKNDHMLRVRAGYTDTDGNDGKILIIADSRNTQRQRDFASQIRGAVTVENVSMDDLVKFGQRLNVSDPEALNCLIDFASNVMTGVSGTNMLQRIATLRAGKEKKAASDAERAALYFLENPSYSHAADLLVEIGKQAGIRNHRPAIFRGGLKILEICAGSNNNIAPYEAAIRVREQSRLIGRPLAKRTVGSTLLLKGLEGDIAVILDPSEMDRKHLYVAMTRGAKNLVICSLSNMI